eukprot:c32329_g1_i1.p1 GENE.c32329_g1_i1~~c32329_g1_i1.p1  ORF type:complete len:181 (-),score=21.03 c32329_g1_i1:22-534(-)
MWAVLVLVGLVCGSQDVHNPALIPELISEPAAAPVEQPVVVESKRLTATALEPHSHFDPAIIRAKCPWSFLMDEKQCSFDKACRHECERMQFHPEATEERLRLCAEACSQCACETNPAETYGYIPGSVFNLECHDVCNNHEDVFGSTKALCSQGCNLCNCDLPDLNQLSA